MPRTPAELKPGEAGVSSPMTPVEIGNVESVVPSTPGLLLVEVVCLPTTPVPLSESPRTPSPVTE
jgi:hypothetical protein